MACSTIHLAIAKRYFDNHHDINYDDLIAGSLYPDACSDDEKEHFTNINRGEDNLSHVREKVNLYNFLEEHRTLNDFELGWFLHLVTDYLFFLDCFTEEYLISKSYKEFCSDLYFAYTHLNLYLTDKYNILDDDYKAYPSEYYPGEEYVDCVLSKEMIDNFIEKVASIDIEKYIDKIRINKCNVEPDN